ncbi:2-oxoisovalerate dehydrogenase E1 subunit beta [Brucella suis]|nr:2-oxoisovalerate dehydrogenase E1 subunit beta [Brucella suis]
MTKMTMIEAIQNAHDIAMERDQKVVVFGEDVVISAASSAAPPDCRRNTARNAARCADQRAWHRRHGNRHGRLRPAALIECSSPIMLSAYDQMFRKPPLRYVRQANLPARRDPYAFRGGISRTDPSQALRRYLPMFRPQDRYAVNACRR